MQNHSDKQLSNHIQPHELVPFQANGASGGLGVALVERVRRPEQATKQLSAYEEEIKEMYAKYIEERERLRTEVVQGLQATYVASSVGSK